MNEQEVIESAINELGKYCKSSFVLEISSETAKVAIEALEKQKNDEWIPINPDDETTYPESFTEVVFTDGDYIYIGCCDPNYIWSSTNQEDSILIDKVKAWKVLPEPYKEGTNGKE